MQKSPLILALFAAVVATGQVQKQQPKRKKADAEIIRSGNQIYDLCQYYKTGKVKDRAGFGCFMYISGAAQTLVLNDDTEMMKSPCPGKGVTDQQITDVVVKWMEDHPEKRDLAAPYIVMRALNEAFPCN